MMDGDSSGSSKRRRVVDEDASSPPPPSGPHITDLPDNILVDVAAYLPTPSRVMFATAMTAPTSSLEWEIQPTLSSACNIILSSISPEDRHVLNFEDVEFDLASKLTDDDLFAILVCIDAVNNLQILKMAGCVNIVGNGLDQLLGSHVLKQIDLSLVKQHDKEEAHPKSTILCEGSVIPILDSIIDTNGNSLRHVHFPEKWSRGYPPDLQRFIQKFNSLMSNHQFSCSKCDASISEPFITEDRDSNFGIYNNTCYSCLSHFCGGCENSEGQPYLRWCAACSKDYCIDCVGNMNHCPRCDCEFCIECSEMNDCAECHHAFCYRCCATDRCPCWNGGRCLDCGVDVEHCEYCSKVNCDECKVDGDSLNVKFCESCYTSNCGECRFLHCKKDWDDVCPECLGMCGSIIGNHLGENEREKEQLSNENQKLRQEIEQLNENEREKEQLSSENQNLRQEIEQLKSQMHSNRKSE